MLGRKSLLHFLGSILSWGLSFVCLYLATNYIGVDAYGTVVLLTSVLTMINVVADLGFSNAHVKRISEGKDLNDCISTYLIIKVNLTCVFVIVSFAALILWNFVGGAPTGGSLDVFLILIFFEIFLTLANIVVFTFQGTTQSAMFQLMQVVNPLVRIPLTVAIVIFGGGAVELAWTYAIGTLTMMVLGLILLRRIKFHFVTPTLIRSYLDFSLPLIIMSIVVVLGANIDKVVIGIALGDLSVGSFSTAQVFLAMVATIGVAVATLTFPDFSKLFTEGRFEEIRSKSWFGERYITMLTLPITLVVMLFPGPFLTALFGPDVISAADALRILALANFILLANQVHYSQILAANKPRVIARMTILSVIVLLILLFTLVPSKIFGVTMFGWGLVGAGMAWLICNIVIVVLTRFSVKKISGTKLNPRIIRHILCGVITAAILWFVDVILPAQGLMILMLYVLMAFLIFFVLLTAVGEFGKEDRMYFLNLVSPKEMFSYISSELNEKK